MRTQRLTLDEKLSVYRDMKEAGFKGTWDEYQRVKEKPKPPAPPVNPYVDTISLDDYDPTANPPRPNPQEELGF